MGTWAGKWRCSLRFPRSLPTSPLAGSEVVHSYFWPSVPAACPTSILPAALPASGHMPLGTAGSLRAHSGWDGGSPPAPLGSLRLLWALDLGTSFWAPHPSSAAGGDCALQWDRARACRNLWDLAQRRWTGMGTGDSQSLGSGELPSLLRTHFLPPRTGCLPGPSLSAHPLQGVRAPPPISHRASAVPDATEAAGTRDQARAGGTDKLESWR